MIGPVPNTRTAQLEAFLLEQPTHHLLCLGLLAQFGPSAFLACVQNGQLTGVAYAGAEGLVVPAGIKSIEAAYELGEALRQREVKILLGETSVVGTILRALNAPRLRGQCGRLCTATPDDMGPYVTPALRLAAEADIPALIEIGEAYHKEIGHLPPPGGVEKRVTARVMNKSIWVIEQESTVAFRVDIAARSNHGAHVDVIYTVPAYRGRGLAATGLGQLARSTLARLPRLSALAPEPNPAAATVVRKVGFGPALPWRCVDLRRGVEQETTTESAA